MRVATKSPYEVVPNNVERPRVPRRFDISVIANSPQGTWNAVVLQERDRRTGHTNSEIPFIGGWMKRQARKSSDVCFGSLADITLGPRDVRFTPESVHSVEQLGCPLCAKSRHW